nr:hypothetical protein [Tanacetum cinerariifolium]
CGDGSGFGGVGGGYGGSGGCWGRQRWLPWMAAGVVVCGVAADCGWGQGRSGGGDVSGVGDDDGDGVRWRYGGEVGRVRESDIRDRIDRKVGSIFGFAGKRPPEKFSGGGSVVAGGGCRIWGREYY